MYWRGLRYFEKECAICKKDFRECPHSAAEVAEKEEADRIRKLLKKYNGR
jgi:hypothetical protein